MGYPKPSYTQTPNVLFDDHLAEMGDAELKVVLVVCRQTFGWHKESDRLSISQFEKKTGMSRQGVLNGIGSAIDRGIIGREKEGQSFRYFLLVNEVDSTSQRSRHTKENTTSSENIFSVYENNIGLLTQSIAEKLKDASDEYPDDWIVEAIEIAVKYNKRNWAYCEAILRRWESDGKDDGQGGKPEKSLKEKLQEAGYK